MKFIVVKTIVVTTRELYEIEIAEHLDPLSYIGDRSPTSSVREREVKADVFRDGENVESL